MSTTQHEPETTTGLYATIDRDPLANYLETLQTYVDEARLNVTDGGLECVAVDPANVGCVDSMIDASTFNDYAPGGTDRIGVNLDRFSKVVGFANSDDVVELNLNAETRKLEITIGDMTYRLALIDPQYIRQDPDIPDELPIESELTVDVDDLERGLGAASMASDYVRISTVAADSEQALVIEAYNTDKDEARLALERDELHSADVGDAESMFSIDYLEKALKPLPGDSLAQLRLGDDCPVKLSSELPDGDGRVLYMIAPRLDTGGA